MPFLLTRTREPLRRTCECRIVWIGSDKIRRHDRPLDPCRRKLAFLDNFHSVLCQNEHVERQQKGRLRPLFRLPSRLDGIGEGRLIRERRSLSLGHGAFRLCPTADLHDRIKLRRKVTITARCRGDARECPPLREIIGAHA